MIASTQKPKEQKMMVIKTEIKKKLTQKYKKWGKNIKEQNWNDFITKQPIKHAKWYNTKQRFWDLEQISIINPKIS